MFNEAAGKLGCLLVFIGFNVTFLTQFFLGHQGMPRRYYAYLPEYQLMHQISTIGSWILAVGLFWTLGYLIASLISGKKAPANPWGGVSLEWHTAEPADRAQLPREPHVTRQPLRLPGDRQVGRLPPPH
jgi:cytochrome c oxidase subunit 1